MQKNKLGEPTQILNEYFEAIEEYYANDARMLRKKVDKILIKFGGLAQKDYDDFYSIAGVALAEAQDTLTRDKNNGQRKNVRGYLYRCIIFAIMSEISRINANKRKQKEEVIDEEGRKKTVFMHDLSLDAPIGDEDGGRLKDTLPSDFELEAEVINKSFTGYSDNVAKYIESLSPRQRKISELIMDGYNVQNIKETLGLSDKQYTKAINEMKSFEKTRVLRKSYDDSEGETKMEVVAQTTQTLEKNKDDRLSIASIIKKIDNCMIRFDHPLQRSSDQWTPRMKSNLISDILQGNPIPEIVLAEQVVNGLAIIWDIDGKQRCTYVHSFRYDGYKIWKKVKRGIIKYQAIIKANGKPVLDENGFPVSEMRECDIRNKTFSELPEELQDKFLDYDFKIVQYLNCSSEDIAYHIERYNDGRPMNASQKGFTRIGEEFAMMVKSIAAMPFFKDMGGYTDKEGTNGTVERVVVESIMTTNFLDNWKKSTEDMCEFMKESASVEHFDRFEDMVDRISKVGTKEVLKMFTSKDSFIWFGLFAKFTNTGLDDEKYVEFMAEFARLLHSKKIDDVSYDDLNGKSTKDKNVVIGKISHLEKLMMQYLDLEPEEINNSNLIDFVKAMVSENISEEDINAFKDDLEIYTLDIDNTSPLLESANEFSLIAIIAYGYSIDATIDQWFVEYFNKNNTYSRNQKENYLHMKEDLDRYLRQRQVA